MTQPRPRYAPPEGFARLRLTVAWDGAAYAGWQSQPSAPSVQDTLQGAFLRLTPDVFRPVAAGRTDAGVHAEAMPVHVDVPARFGLPLPRLARALNAHLPPTLAVLDVGTAPPGFHARFSCSERRYVYRLLRTPQRLKTDSAFVRGRFSACGTGNWCNSGAARQQARIDLQIRQHTDQNRIAAVQRSASTLHC